MGFIVGLILGVGVGLCAAYIGFVIYLHRWWAE